MSAGVISFSALDMKEVSRADVMFPLVIQLILNEYEAIICGIRILSRNLGDTPDSDVETKKPWGRGTARLF
jgi:hypothetical protein